MIGLMGFRTIVLGHWSHRDIEVMPPSHALAIIGMASIDQLARLVDVQPPQKQALLICAPLLYNRWCKQDPTSIASSSR